MAEMVEFLTEKDGTVGRGYLAAPSAGPGPGVLVMHAWWGLNDFFKGLCDSLAEEGFVALAPDLYGGPTAKTAAEAEQLLKGLDYEATRAVAVAAVRFLENHTAVNGEGLGAVGFSMGGAWSALLASVCPHDINAVVIFYGTSDSVFEGSRSAFLGHFAENDEWEAPEDISQMEENIRKAGCEVTFHTYPGARHWFFEADRPEDFDPAAAQQAWDRTLAFLRQKLVPPATMPGSNGNPGISS